MGFGTERWLSFVESLPKRSKYRTRNTVSLSQRRPINNSRPGNAVVESQTGLMLDTPKEEGSGAEVGLAFQNRKNPWIFTDQDPPSVIDKRHIASGGSGHVFEVRLFVRLD
jgi:hypothetical protein